MSNYIRMLANWLRSADDWQGLHWDVENKVFQDQLKEAVRRPLPEDLRLAGIFHCDDLTGAWGQPEDTHLFLADLYNPEEWLYLSPAARVNMEAMHKSPIKWCERPFLIYVTVRAGFVYQLTVNNERDGAPGDWGPQAQLHGYPLVCTLAQATELLGEPQEAMQDAKRITRYWKHLYQTEEWAYYVNIQQVYAPGHDYVRWHTIYSYRRMLGSGMV